MLNYRRIYRFFIEWPYIFEALIALPSVLLEAIVSGSVDIFGVEKEIARNGEFDEDIKDACGLCSHSSS